MALVPIVEPTRKCATEIIGMIHVHATTAVENHCLTPLLQVAVPTPKEVETLGHCVSSLQSILANRPKTPLIDQMCLIEKQFRSYVFFLTEAVYVLQTLRQLPFISHLIERAVLEAKIYEAEGISFALIENIAAPYFVGAGQCTWEELIILHLTAQAVRQACPSMCLGVHCLSSNELEVLPIAVINGAAFVRSEATLFAGMRPEGQTSNSGNLARFFYLRNILNTMYRPDRHGQTPYPQIWSDVQKKHTVFPAELLRLDDWLHNISFMKLEGVIITGLATGSDADEADLIAARKAIVETKAWIAKTFLDNLLDKEEPSLGVPQIPLITGSGMNFEMYCKYADYIIVGSALKHHNFWENPVKDENVRKVVARIRAAQRS